MKRVLRPILRLLPTHARLSLVQYVRWLRRRREASQYLGEGRVCACCGLLWREFAPAGDPVRANALCLRCGGGERQRLLAMYLTKELAGRSHHRVLHFGPEISLARPLAAVRGVDYLSIDLHPDMGMMQGDITDLPLGDDEFDAVVCTHVLEHVLDDAKALSEIVRVMKPGGTAYIMVPQEMAREETYEDETVVTSQARYREYGQEDHVRIYGRDFVDRLRAAGFAVSELHTSDIADAETCKKFGLGEDVIYVCTAPERGTEPGSVV